MDEPAARALASSFRLTAPPPGFADEPWPVYAALREHDPVHELTPGSFLLTRYADVLAVYRNPQALSDKQREFGPKFGVGTPLFEHHTSSLIFNDPPLHTRVRRILMGALNQRAIARMEASVGVLVERLLDQMADQDTPDLISSFAAQIPIEVIGNLLDMPHADRGPLREWSLAILGALEPAPGPAPLARGHTAVTEFLAYLRTLVADRAQHPGDPETDVLTRLMRGDAGGTLSERELLHNCIFLLNAGHETTTNLIGNGMNALMTQREQLDRLRAEPALMNTAVEEMLRFESPVQLGNRLLAAPMLLGGRELPAGSFITLGIGAANRDPAEFAEPDRLDVGRRPNNHLAFGQAAHACSGMNVARMEARIALARLLARFPRIEHGGAAQRDPRLRFRGFSSLPVRLG